MKRLLICTPSYYVQGGVERILESLALHLPTYGWDIIFGLARGAHFHDPGRYCRAFPHIQAVTINGASGTWEGRRREVCRTVQAVRPDVVLNARLYDVYPAVCSLKAQHNARPYLATLVQSYETEYLVDARHFARSIDLCVSGGELTATALIEWSGLPVDRVISLPGGIAPPLPLQRREHGRIPLRLGYVGRLEQDQKRIRDLPEVLRHLAVCDVSFTMQIVGSGPEEAWLRARLAELSLDDRVQFRGWLPTEVLYREVYPQLDVFLHLANWEGAPIALTEGQLHGVVPVVSTFTGCLTEKRFIHGQNALLFPVGRPERAAAHIERLYQDRSLWDRLSAAGLASRDQVRSPEQMAAAWAECLDRTLARAPAEAVDPPPTPSSGRLERWGLPSTWAASLRHLLHRACVHATPGSEWPHWSGLASPADWRETAELAIRLEEAALPSAERSGVATAS